MLSHPDRIFWSAHKITKEEVFAYYKKVFKKMAPFLKDRPLMIKRFPKGIKAGGFFQKNMKQKLPKFMATCKVIHQNRVVYYPMVQNLKTLEYLVNLGTIEFHIFLAKKNSLKTPDFILFDLDPVSVSFEKVCKVALLLKKELKKKGFSSTVRTTGKRGLHIALHNRKKLSFEKVRSFAKKIAKTIQNDHPELVSLERAPKKRKGKVYIDTLQNAFGKTVICPYSLRGENKPTIATPVSWKMVESGFDPKTYALF